MALIRTWLMSLRVLYLALQLSFVLAYAGFSQLENQLSAIDTEIARLQLLRAQLVHELGSPTPNLTVYRSPKFAVSVQHNVTYAMARNCSEAGNDKSLHSRAYSLPLLQLCCYEGTDTAVTTLLDPSDRRLSSF